MAFSDDPKGHRRQPNTMAYPNEGRAGDMRQPVRPAVRPGAPRQPVNQEDDPFGSFDDDHAAPAPRQSAPAPGAGRQQAPQQPSFSAYRPEAYANPEKPAAPARPAPRQAASPAPEPFRPGGGSRQQQHHDPYAASDPYDTGHHDAGWQSFGNDYPEPRSGQFGQAYYAQRDDFAQRDEPASHDAQSMHNQFFAAEPEPEPEPERAPPPPPRAAAPKPAPRPAQREMPDDDFAADFAPEPIREAPRAAPKPVPAPVSRDRGFDDDEDDADFGGDWGGNGFGQSPAPQSVRPFPAEKYAPTDKYVPEDDLDAGYLDGEEDFEDEEGYEEPKKGGKKLMAAVLVGAIVTGGGLAYMYKSTVGGGDSGEPALVTADTRPVKETPTDPGGREFPNGGKMIYDRLDGSTPPQDGNERVASTEEQSSSSDVQGGVVTTGASGTLEERIQNALRDARKQEEPAEPPASASVTTTSNFDAPRPVRTEIFRPDGSVDAARSQRRQAPPEPEAEPAPAARAPAREAPAAAPARTQVAAATPAAISTGGESGMFVQIAARNDQAAAMAAFADLQQKYAAVLGSHSPSVRKVDLGEKGVWYRLLVGPMASKADADKLCEDLKTAGMKGCFSRKE